jgi:hypothetical protein
MTRIIHHLFFNLQKPALNETIVGVLPSLALGNHHETLLDHFLLLSQIVFVAIFISELLHSILLLQMFFLVGDLLLGVALDDTGLDEDLTETWISHCMGNTSLEGGW